MESRDLRSGLGRPGLPRLNSNSSAIRSMSWGSPPTPSLPDVQMTINIVRKLNPNAIIVLGVHCSMFPDYAIELDGADAIITGDGEDAFVEMLEATDAGKSWEGILGVWFKKDGQTIKNPDRPSTKRLDAYPWPDRRRLPRYDEYYLPGTKAPMVTTAITSRLPCSCPFCLTYKSSIESDIDNILDEMEHCVSLGITETHFIDDLFTPNSQWAMKPAIASNDVDSIAGATRHANRFVAATRQAARRFTLEWSPPTMRDSTSGASIAMWRMCTASSNGAERRRSARSPT